jgi:hypothetical protein
MMRTPHCQSGLNGTWIVYKSLFYFILFFGFVVVDSSLFFLIVTFLYSYKRLPSLAPMGLVFISVKDLQFSPSRNFMLPSYVEVEVQVTASMIPPNIKKHVRYDPFVRSLVDDEAIE